MTTRSKIADNSGDRNTDRDTSADDTSLTGALDNTSAPESTSSHEGMEVSGNDPADAAIDVPRDTTADTLKAMEERLTVLEDWYKQHRVP